MKNRWTSMQPINTLIRLGTWNSCAWSLRPSLLHTYMHVLLRTICMPSYIWHHEFADCIAHCREHICICVRIYYIYIYIYICIHVLITHTVTYMYMCIYMSVHTYACISLPSTSLARTYTLPMCGSPCTRLRYVCMYVCMYVCVHVCVCACMYVCIYVCICTNAFMRK
jgi:hypothetical protein